MDQKAQTDVKIPQYFCWQSIQYVEVMASGAKLALSPTEL